MPPDPLQASVRGGLGGIFLSPFPGDRMHQDDPIPNDPNQDVDLGDPSAFGLSSIAERLRWARKQQGPGLEYYLDSSRTNREADGISDQQYRDFEDGKAIPTPDQLFALSKTFNVSARYLNDGSSPIYP